MPVAINATPQRLLFQWEQVAPTLGGVASQVAASARKRTAEESDEAEEEWRRRGAELVGEREGGGRGASVSDKVRGERDGGEREKGQRLGTRGVGKWRPVGAADAFTAEIGRAHV